MNVVKYIDFIDWVRDGKGKPMIHKNKKENKSYYIERWIIEVDGVRKEHIKRELIRDDNENLNPNSNPIKQWLVPNVVTDSVEEVEAYNSFNRKVLGTAGMRIVKNSKLKQLKQRDLKKKAVILEMLQDPSYILYRKYLRIKYKCINAPTMKIVAKWKELPEHIKTTVNNAIEEKMIDD